MPQLYHQYLPTFGPYFWLMFDPVRPAFFLWACLEPDWPRNALSYSKSFIYDKADFTFIFMG